MKKQVMPVWVAFLLLSSCGGSGIADPKNSFPTTGSEDWTLYANPTEKKLRDDFAWGVDLGSLAEVEKAGGKFYNVEGKEEDVFKILADNGSNYARFRLWNDPYDKNGAPYGGGTNDVATDVKLAKRAYDAGMKILVDFHYSDSWADPGKYFSPKAWASLDYEDLVVELGKFTQESLQKFKDAGVKVSSIQIGNEINPGIAGISASNYMRIAEMFRTATEAAKNVFPDVKTIAHYTNVHNPTNLYRWTGLLKQFEALPDVIGVSYYPYWHGTLANLQTVLDKLATDYDVDVAVMETSWGYTDEHAPGYCNNQFSSSTLGEAGGYDTSAQAQVTVLSDIANVLSKVPNQHGCGLFYWEPAWLPLQGSGWINPEGAYYNDYGRDWVGSISKAQLDEKYSESYCYSSWANQAWFDYTGHALPSVSAYKHIRWGDHPIEERIGQLINKTMSITINLSDEWSLPATARAISNLGAHRDCPITWNADQVAAIKNPGYYTVTGTCNGETVTANVKAEKNYIKDPAFEKQSTKEEAAIIAPWEIETTKTYKDFGDCHIESKSEMGGKGNRYLHWYSNTAFSFTLSQNLGNVPAGKYIFGMDLLSSWYDGEQSAAAVKASSLYYSVNGVKTEVDIREQNLGFDAGAHTIELPEITISNEAEVEIGFSYEGGNGCWGHADNFYFSAVIE